MTKLWAIGLMVCCSFFTALGQLFFKRGAILLPAVFTNWQLIAGFASLGVGMIFFVLAMRGGEVSALYPVLATSYLWVNIFAMVFLNEHIVFLKWVGTASIVMGISFIGVGSRKHGN